MQLTGGYGTAYDPKPALNRLGSDRVGAIEELWENLIHQGDIGTASYAAVPALVENGELSLVAAIEVARNDARNPEIPEALRKHYFAALELALASKPIDEEQYQGYYVIHASASGQHRLAKALNLLSVEEILSEYG
jgi:hypothetical protein